MSRCEPGGLSPSQKLLLVVLRTAIGWHFLYEGYFKLILPAWASDGTHLELWSSYGYLKVATGPVAHMLQALFNAGYGHIIDLSVVAGLCVIGLSLMLGLFTQAGCGLALCMLTLFYVTAIPMDGAPHPGMEGNYLLVNKTLIEWVAAAVVFAFQTGRIAGLDLLYYAYRQKQQPRPANGVV